MCVCARLAVRSGSGAMLSEAMHSGADVMNQGLLFYGLRRSAQKSDTDHPCVLHRALGALTNCLGSAVVELRGVGAAGFLSA